MHSSCKCKTVCMEAPARAYDCGWWLDAVCVSSAFFLFCEIITLVTGVCLFTPLLMIEHGSAVVLSTAKRWL